MFFCRKCLIAAAAAPKVLTPILVPAATLTEEEEEEEEEEGENQDSTPKMINASCTFAYTMILEHVYSNALPYLIIESVMKMRLFWQLLLIYSLVELLYTLFNNLLLGSNSKALSK